MILIHLYTKLYVSRFYGLLTALDKTEIQPLNNQHVYLICKKYNKVIPMPKVFELSGKREIIELNGNRVRVIVPEKKISLEEGEKRIKKIFDKARI